jgi:hypothetical protein
MVFRESWIKQALVSFSKTTNTIRPSDSILMSMMLFEKLTRAYFIQIALETILLPILRSRLHGTGRILLINAQSIRTFSTR